MPTDLFSGFLRHRQMRKDRAVREAERRKGALKAVGPLLERYGAERAYAFGSIIDGACREESDIDLFVEGIEPEQFWDLWRDLETRTGESIDLYCTRDDPTLIRKIRERGWMFHEARHRPAQG